MKKFIKKLHKLSLAEERRVIGLMSGTSLDGLDVALCVIRGSGLKTSIMVEKFETIPFDDSFKTKVKKVFSKEMVSLQELTLLNPYVALQHAAIVNSLLLKWNYTADDIDLIASHGQTIYHAPKSLHQQPNYGNATLQIGDGDHLAVATGIITISDFRQKHIAAGGEGAPLAVYGDYLIFSSKVENRILLNIGGIANFTFLPANSAPSQIFSTDTGPGNTMMDAYMFENFGKYFDDEASIASRGNISQELLNTLKANPYFDASFPKTTGPELFNLKYLKQAQTKSNTISISKEDVMATLNKFSADTIIDAILRSTILDKSYTIFMSGGGMHNPLLVQQLKKGLPQFTFKNTNALQVNPDAKEAVLFALLANECIAGDTDYFSETIAGFPKTTMGKISLP